MRSLVITAAIGFAATGCQSVGTRSESAVQPISLNEAKQITAEFNIPLFEPPQRSIADLERKFGPMRDIPGDCDATRAERAAFELRRASARGFSNRIEYNKAWTVNEFVGLIEDELSHGNYVRAEAFLRDRLQVKDERNRSARGQLLVQLARVHAATGDTRAAQGAVNRANVFYRRWMNTYSQGAALRDFYIPLGEAAVAQAGGSLVRAEALQRQVLDNVYAMWGTDRALLWSELAANLVQQGRPVEAEVEARKAIDEAWRRGTQFTRKTGRTVARLSEILLEQERVEDARVMADYAVNMHEADCAEPDSLSLALSLQVRAKTLAATGRWAGIVEIFARLESAFSQDGATFDRLYRGNPDWALALVDTGNSTAALSNLETGVANVGAHYGEDSYEMAELVGIRAMARLAAGDHVEALADFRRAAPVLMAGSRGAGRTSGRFTRDLRRRLVLESYMELLDEARDVDTLFRVAEAVRGDVVQRDVATSAVRSLTAETDPELAQLIRRTQDATQRIAAALEILANLAAAPTGEGSGPLSARMRERVAELRAAQVALASEVRSRFPNYADLVEPEPPGLDEVREKLRPREALVAFYVAPERTYAWAVSHSGPAAFAAVPVGRRAIAERINVLRAALAPEVATVGDIPEFDLARAHELFAELLGPVASGWERADTLLVIGDGALREIPFHVLPTAPSPRAKDSLALFDGYRGVSWLARSHAVVELPTAATLVSLRDLAPANRGGRPMAGFGDPWFSAAHAAAGRSDMADATALAASDAAVARRLALRRRSAVATRGTESATSANLPRLPETADEVLAIASVLGADPTANVFLGARASESNARNPDLADRRVLVFATHGLVPGDLDGLTQPALALSSPEVTGASDDGLLTMSEILGLELRSEWVVLSACNTAAGNGAGAMAVSGLGRAFFYAGARALLVTHWPVETTSARALTTSTFQRQQASPGLSRAQALQRSMLELIDEGGARDAGGRMVFSYAHPIFWAPFAMVGESGGR